MGGPFISVDGDSTQRAWAAFATSADGERVYAVDGGDIYYSTDAGYHLSALDTFPGTGGAGSLYAIACDADCSTIVALTQFTIWTSATAGVCVPAAALLSVCVWGGRTVCVRARARALLLLAACAAAALPPPRTRRFCVRAHSLL